MNIRAILFGATGMVGEGVLHEALKNDAVTSVLVVGRRPTNAVHTKLSEILHDNFFDYGSIKTRLQGYDACFFCLGVTSIGKSEEEYKRLTYDLTIAAATILAESNPAMTFCYVSGAGTDESGKQMWARVKGKTENDLMKLPFKKVYAFRPGYIKPSSGLKNAFLASRLVAPFYPVMKILFGKYVCTLEDLGRSMIQAAAAGYTKNILECEDITRLARSG